MLKKAHLLRYPAASPSCRRGKKSLFIRRDATPHLFLSAGSCICLPAEAAAQAGAFLNILGKTTFPAMKFLGQ